MNSASLSVRLLLNLVKYGSRVVRRNNLWTSQDRRVRVGYHKGMGMFTLLIRLNK